MKKFKLIKEYPLSPPLETIVEYKKNHGIEGYYWNNPGRGLFGIYGLNPIDHPEYWEEVIEKDYEILSFKYKREDNWLWDFKKGDIIPVKFENNQYYFQRRNGIWGSHTKDNGLNLDVFEIHSIKRLSDGEVL